MNSKETSSENHLLISYLQLRRNIGCLGFGLPIVLAFGGKLVFGLEVQSSISAYYYTGMRGIFVGFLWAIGVFLYSYKGYEKEENWAVTDVSGERRLKALRAPQPLIQFWRYLNSIPDNWVGNVAGISGILVALLPTAPPHPSRLEAVIGIMHFVSAFVFLMSLAFFSLVLFVKTTKSCISDQKRNRNRVYRWCGSIIIAALVLIGVVNLVPDAIANVLDPFDPVFWLEAIAVFAFGVSWFVKGEGILKDDSKPDKPCPDHMPPRNHQPVGRY